MGEGEGHHLMRYALYGGLIAENITQAAARDLLADAMLRVEDAGYPLVLTVHDELIAEVPIGFGDLKEFERLVSRIEPWADGLPVAAKGYRGKRFRKG
jgi:DNA polymerase